MATTRDEVSDTIAEPSASPPKTLPADLPPKRAEATRSSHRWRKPVLWLVAVLALSRGLRFSAQRHAAVQLSAMYWHFVVALWLVLFPAVYLL